MNSFCEERDRVNMHKEAFSHGRRPTRPTASFSIYMGKEKFNNSEKRETENKRETHSWLVFFLSS